MKPVIQPVECPPHVPDRNKVCTKCKEQIQLYCIAYEYRVKLGVWDADFLYLHATSDGDARWQFFNSETEQAKMHMRVVGIAPVLGYLVNDNHGEDLTV